MYVPWGTCPFPEYLQGSVSLIASWKYEKEARHYLGQAGP